MFPKNIKLILAIALLGYGVYQITETYIGNGIFMFLLSIIVIVLYFKNEILILAFLSLRKQNFDKTHDEHEASLQKDLTTLASEHEILATATQQDFKSMEQSLDSESNSLENNFNEQLEQLKTHLEHVSKELSSSKTDRKTLAKLLATMATNLENDPL